MRDDGGPRHRSRPGEHGLRRRGSPGQQADAADAGVIRTLPTGSPERRLAELHEGLCTLLDEHQPDAVALEALYFGVNVRSAFAVGQARGVVLPAPGSRGIPCSDYTPQQVKSAVCGSGRAAKDQVAQMVAAVLALDAPPSPDHAADALAVAICHANRAPLAARGARVIALVAGDVAVRRPDHVVVETAGGVGYRLAVSAETLRQVPAVGTAVSLHTHLVVRDDALDLYGFATEEERDLFLMLIGVQSVGPKMALAVLSGGPPRELVARAGRRRRRPPAGRARASASARPSGSSSSCARRSASFPTTPAPRSPSRAATTRAAWRATACSSSASRPPRRRRCVEAATGETAEELLASALRGARA